MGSSFGGTLDSRIPMELLRPRKLLRMPPRIFKDGQSIECEKKAG